MKQSNWNKYKEIWIGGIIGGIICFILPWLFFLIRYTDCHVNQQTDCGFGLSILFGLIIIFSLVVLILGFIIGH